MSVSPEGVTLREYHSLGVITWREREALEMRFEGRGLSLGEIAEALGISRWAVRDRIKSGLRKIAAFEERAA